jgi:nickel superoxide dismutase
MVHCGPHFSYEEVVVILLETVFGVINRILPIETAHAHCDIPCGIYDPHAAQIAALSTVRMNQLIDGMEKPGPDTSPDDRVTAVAKLSRYVVEKERSAEQCKHELRIIWGDYVKPNHVTDHPDIHEKFIGAMRLASAVRQNNGLQAAEDLLAAVQEIAEVFWKTKGANTTRQPSRHAVGHELVYPA